MHVLQGRSYLMYVFPASLLRKTHIFLYGFFHDEFEVPLLRPLDCDEQLIELVVDEPIQILHDIRMV